MNDDKESWHVGKESPLAMLFAIFIQTGDAIWWARIGNPTTQVK